MLGNARMVGQLHLALMNRCSLHWHLICCPSSQDGRLQLVSVLGLGANASRAQGGTRWQLPWDG
jgi:hypothetical protein